MLLWGAVAEGGSQAVVELAGVGVEVGFAADDGGLGVGIGG